MTAPGRGVFFSCGEVSGDWYAAGVVKALRKKGFDGPVFGMGGLNSAKEGAEIVRDSRALHLMGVADVIPAIPRLLKLKDCLVRLVLSRSPGAVLLIDSPDFHLPLARSLRKGGWKGPIVYAVPPTVWAWRSGRVKDLRRDVDLCLPLFRFEHDFLLRAGVESAWIGHPMTEEFASFRRPPVKARQIALLPGSRRSEVLRLLSPLLECADLAENRGYEAVFSVAPGMSEDLRDLVKKELSGRRVWEGPGRDLMAESAAVAGASGTAAVEAMMAGKFMAVLYKGGFLSWLAWKTLVKTPFISIPNLLAGGEVYPEFIQGRATGKNAFAALMCYLEDGPFMKETDRKLSAAQRAMGAPGALDFWAGRLMDLPSRGRGGL